MRELQQQPVARSFVRAEIHDTLARGERRLFAFYDQNLRVLRCKQLRQQEERGDALARPTLGVPAKAAFVMAVAERAEVV